MQISTAKSLRIVFMGTPDFAVESLRKLVTNGYNIVGVITAADKPSGRGQKIKSSAVKVYAEEHDLTVLQPTNLKSEEFQKSLEALQPDLQIVVAFRMLPKSVWSLPKYGTFNLHASLLPDYRGAAPIHWAIINGETTTGVTTFFIDDKIDTGAILLQRSTAIKHETTVGELHDQLMEIGSDLVLETVDGIAERRLKPQVQSDTGDLKTAYKLHRDNCKIDWEADVEKIYNKIRGLNPFPAAWCYLKQADKKEMIKIYKVGYSKEAHSEAFGSIFSQKDHLKIAVKNGFIQIYEIQLPGKRKMTVKALLNGLHFNINDKLC
jgi:methionyl-tRNA formyltransferase